MDNFVTLLGLSTLSSCLVLFVLWLCREWFITRLTQSIEHEYATKLEEYKYQIEVKRKAELVARLLAEWLRDSSDRFELNKMAFESYLWLPDDIARDLADLLAHDRDDEVSTKKVLIKVRRYLNDGNKDYKSLTSDDLTHFSRKKHSV